MKVSYQHSNPRTGNESVLLRFEDEGAVNQTRTPCILVDSGEGVDVDALFTEGDYLVAIILTHAHIDHYKSLADNLRDGAPIYTSEPTARILKDTLSEAKQHNRGVGDVGEVLDAIEPFDDWVSPIPELRIGPVPAGHVPGAIGILVQFKDDENDGGRKKSIFLTGDWTPQRAAGYPGVDTGLPVNVGAVFLTAAVNDDYTEKLTASILKIYKRVSAGSSVLVTASGLTSVRYAYLLGHISEEFQWCQEVTLVGQAAKHYENLGYDVPNVESVSNFDDPEKVMKKNAITIAGPARPDRKSSGRLFGTIRNDPGATLIQILSGSENALTSAGCTICDFEVIPHPALTEIDTVVEDIDPTQVIITHRDGRASDRFKDAYNSYVWTTDGTNTNTIYADGEWSAPPWMTEEGRSYVHQGNGPMSGLWFGDVADADDDSITEIPLPEYTRTDHVDLNQEGLDVEALEQQFSHSLPTTTSETKGEGDITSDAATEFPYGAQPSSEEKSIADRLDAIESQLAGPTTSVQVVDAGGGIQLLRVLNDNLNVEHGDTFEIVPQRLFSGSPAGDSTRQKATSEEQQNEDDMNEMELQD